MSVARVGTSRPVLFAVASALVLIGLSPGALAQTLESRVENLEAHDEILRSRQEVLTGDVNDFKADVASATAALRAEVSAIAVPVGGVIAWWGTLGSIPENFELCDGNAPTTPGAVLTGNKPDLRERFVRGAVSSAGATGGRDTIEDASTAPHILTLEELPAHNHVPDRIEPDDTNAGYTDFNRLMMVNNNHTPEGWNTTMNTPDEPNIITSREIKTEGGDQPHSHGIPGHDNRPAFCELFYIIRVK